MNKVDYSIIYPNIYVYHNAINNPQLVVEQIKKDNSWTDWYTFGKVIRNEQDLLYSDNNFPSLKQWQEISETQTGYLKELLESFYKVTNDYVQITNFNLPNWEFSLPNICEYNPESNLHKDYAMHYHTDYQLEYADFPASKPGLTVTMYLNDTYAGGSLLFKIKNKETGNVDSCSYKPKAGDIVIFPSKDPYYHAVESVHEDNKYFVRSFWQYYQPATESWTDGIKKYGEEVWVEMKEKEAKEKSRVYGNNEWLKENLGVDPEA